jgi:hypothetical protein
MKKKPLLFLNQIDMTNPQKLEALNSLSQQEKAGAFYEEIKKDIPRFLTVSLCVAGQTMEETNANQMKISTEATFNGKRYKVVAKFTLSELKNG